MRSEMKTVKGWERMRRKHDDLCFFSPVHICLWPLLEIGFEARWTLPHSLPSPVLPSLFLKQMKQGFCIYYVPASGPVCTFDKAWIQFGKKKKSNNIVKNWTIICKAKVLEPHRLSHLCTSSLNSVLQLQCFALNADHSASSFGLLSPLE